MIEKILRKAMRKQKKKFENKEVEIAFT